MKGRVNNGAEFKLTASEWRIAKILIRVALGAIVALAGHAVRTEFALAGCKARVEQSIKTMLLHRNTIQEKTIQ